MYAIVSFSVWNWSLTAALILLGWAQLYADVLNSKIPHSGEKSNEVHKHSWCAEEPNTTTTLLHPTEAFHFTLHCFTWTWDTCHEMMEQKNPWGIAGLHPKTPKQILPLQMSKQTNLTTILEILKVSNPKLGLHEKDKWRPTGRRRHPLTQQQVTYPTHYWPKYKLWVSCFHSEQAELSRHFLLSSFYSVRHCTAVSLPSVFVNTFSGAQHHWSTKMCCIELVWKEWFFMFSTLLPCVTFSPWT